MDLYPLKIPAQHRDLLPILEDQVIVSNSTMTSLLNGPLKGYPWFERFVKVQALGSELEEEKTLYLQVRGAGSINGVSGDRIILGYRVSEYLRVKKGATVTITPEPGIRGALLFHWFHMKPLNRLAIRMALWGGFLAFALSAASVFVGHVWK